jgi:S-adenosylmethionine:tRNA ribosyltransferase-isomerase
MKILTPAPDRTDILPDNIVAESGFDLDAFEFELPPELEAGEPPEARGLARDEVRLMVSHYSEDRVNHTQFRKIVDFLNPGDVLVINTSGTLNAALNVTRADGTSLELHLSTQLPADLWIVELRQRGERATQPFYHAAAGETLHLPGGGSATLLVPYRPDQRAGYRPDQRAGYHPDQKAGYRPGQKAGYYPDDHSAFTKGAAQRSHESHIRLWIATLHLPSSLEEYLARYGSPIRYNYVKNDWPSSYYQTVYATQMGSAEMPSAGRAFTPELLTQLVACGVHIVPLILHTGVASLEDHEPPYEEFYRVPLETSRVVNKARTDGKRVVAVGTTVVRALETVADEEGSVHPGQGWTRLVITPQRGLRVIDGLLTGLHEPRATHLAMLEALAGPYHLQMAYAEAIQRGYLWHEFGDLHLILP